MKMLHFIYNDQNIDFDLNGTQSIMVNATEMAKIFDKDVRHFLKAESIKLFKEKLDIFLENEIIRAPNGERIIQKSVEYRGRNGVFFEKRLALKFGGWLNVDFDLWIYDRIHKVIMGAYQDHKDATAEKLQAKHDYEVEKIKLMEKYPEVANLFGLISKISNADKSRIKAIKESDKQIMEELFPNEFPPNGGNCS